MASAGERLPRMSAFSIAARSQPGFRISARSTSFSAIADVERSVSPVLSAASATAKRASARSG